MPYQEPHGARSAQGKLLEEAIGRQVKQYREKLGLTIAELAKAADMSAGMLSKVENGATSPSLSIAAGPVARLACAGNGALPFL